MKTDEDLFRAGDREALEKLFARHKDDVYRTARRILRHDADGLSYEEVAQILDWPRGTVGTNIHRGLERLRTALAGSFASSDRILIALLENPPPLPPSTGPDTALACGPPNPA